MSPSRATPGRGTPSSRAASGGAASGSAASSRVQAAREPVSVADRASAAAREWAPVAARILLALVLAWFGYHELVRPGLWTGYVPLLAPTSHVAVVAVLAHGWVLLMLAVALVAGIATRLAALVAAVALLEIIISLAVTAGLSDLTLRDVGVLGLAVSLTGVRHQRFTLRR